MTVTPLTQPKFLLISGPPGAGKDTVGRIIHESRPDATQEKFAKPLIEAAAAFGFDMRESVKDDFQHRFGTSRRQFQISLSEDWAKKFMGTAVFGKALLGRVQQSTDAGFTPELVVVTDSGFCAEAAEVSDAVGFANVSRIHLTRPGHDYSGDSRTDWAVPEGMQRFDIWNSASIEELRPQIISILALLDLIPAKV